MPAPWVIPAAIAAGQTIMSSQQQQKAQEQAAAQAQAQALAAAIEGIGGNQGQAGASPLQALWQQLQQGGGVAAFQPSGGQPTGGPV